MIASKQTPYKAFNLVVVVVVAGSPHDDDDRTLTETLIPYDDDRIQTKTP